MKLRAENIMKSYRGRKVVKGISLEVNQGEIIGLLGPNGAGPITTTQNAFSHASLFSLSHSL